jgi:hypothetical protein
MVSKRLDVCDEFGYDALLWSLAALAAIAAALAYHAETATQVASS